MVVTLQMIVQENDLLEKRRLISIWERKNSKNIKDSNIQQVIKELAKESKANLLLVAGLQGSELQSRRVF